MNLIEDFVFFVHNGDIVKGVIREIRQVEDPTEFSGFRREYVVSVDAKVSIEQAEEMKLRITEEMNKELLDIWNKELKF